MSHNRTEGGTKSDPITYFFPTKSICTQAAYRNDLESFASYLGKESTQEALELLLSLPESQANLVVLHFKSELLQSRQSASSINRKLSTLRSLVKAAKKCELVSWKLDVSNEKVKGEDTATCLNKQALSNLLKAAGTQSNPKKAARDYAIVRLLYDLALKRNSISSLQLSQFDPHRKILEIADSRNHPARVKRLPPKTSLALNRWLQHRGTEPGPLFHNLDVSQKKKRGISATSIYRIVKQLGASLGLRVTPEEIRKSSITEAVSQARRLGLSDHEILAFTDHKHTVSLQRFKRTTTKIQESLSNLVSQGSNHDSW